MSGKNHKSTFIFLGLGILFIIGSIPMFLLRKPLVVSHQAYKYSSSSIEVITPEFGPLYGILLVAVGGFFIWIFLRIRAASRSGEVDLEDFQSKTMTWNSIAEILREEYRRLLPDLPTFPGLRKSNETPAEALLRLELSTTEKVDHAVRSYAQKRRWPDLTEKEKLMLSFRLEFAGTLASLLAEQPRPWTDSEDAALFEERIGWLMLFAWNHGGFDQAANSIDFVTTGNKRKEA